jgi:CubicO group peptidase (beta-lactamase class C family)
MYSTARDLVRWLEATRQETLVHPSRLPYPYGWHRDTRLGRDVLEQNGRVPIGYVAYAGIYPKDDLVIVLLSNIPADVVDRMASDLAAIALGEHYTLHERRIQAARVTAADSSALAPYAGRFQIAPGFVLTVRAERRGLLLAGPDGIFVPIVFGRDAAGQVSQLQWGDSFTALRIR